jgi:hypothetical protein
MTVIRVRRRGVVRRWVGGRSWWLDQPDSSPYCLVELSCSAMRLFDECSSHKNTGAHRSRLLLGVFGSSNHGLEFLLELGGLGILSVIILCH